MTFIDLSQTLRTQLLSPLPGAAAQREFEPQLSYGRHFGPIPDDARHAAVMLLLFPNDESEWVIPLTIRSPHIRHHPGQVSLPGGGVHQGEPFRQAAIRETWEELGVQVDECSLIGELSPIYVWASNYLVNPYVAVLEGRPDFVACPSEVQEIIEVPVSRLADPNHRGSHRIVRHGVCMSVPHINWQGHTIWGTTAMILAEFLAVMESFIPNPSDSLVSA